MVDKISRSQALVLLRYTLIIAMAYLVLVEHGFSSTPSGLILLIVVALASNVVVAQLPARITESTFFYAGIILGDTLWITAALVYSGLFGAEFFYLYFFVLLLAGIGENMGLIAVGATVVCIAYIFVLSTSGGSASIWSSRLLIRIPFLLTAAAFYGYIVDRVRRERQRAREKADTVVYLEEVQRTLADHAQQLERANDELALEVSERERAEQAARAAKDYAESLIDSSLDMIISTDVNRNIVEFNKAAEEAFGWSRADVVDNPIDVLYTDSSESLRVQHDVRQTGKFAGEIRNKRKNGESFHVFLSASVIRDATGRIVGGVGVSRDITETKRVEADLKARAKQQGAVAALGQRALAGTDLSTLMGEAVTLIGQTLEVEYCKVLELLPDGNSLLLRAGVGWKEGYVGHATVGVGSDSQAGYTLFAKEAVIVDDLRREPRFSGPPLLHEHAVVSGLSIIIQGSERPFGVLGAHTTRRRTFTKDDVHFLQAIANVLGEAIERRRAEEALKEARARLQYLIASNPAVIYSNQGFGEFACTFVSENFQSAMGYASREMLGNSQFWINNVHPDDRARVLSDLPRLIPEGGGILEYRFRHRDGHYCWVQDMFKVMSDEAGRPLEIIGSWTDITERKRAEEALRESEERYRMLFENAPIGLGVADTDGTLLAFNNAMLEPGGYTREDIAKIRNVDHLYEDPDQRAIMMASARMQGSVHQQEVRFKRKDGSCYPALLSLTPVKIEGRDGWQAMVQDITERKRAEEELQTTQLQLMQSAKLESVGRLAAGVAHEVKNPLAIVLQGLAYLSSLPVADDKVAIVLQKMDDAVKRADRVIGGLLDFSGQRPGDIRSTELNSLLEQSLLLVHHELVKARVTVIKVVGENLPQLKLDRYKIEQVFVNLFLNAIQAMPEGGTITVKTRAKQLTDVGPYAGRGKIDESKIGKALVMVEVEDTGIGIPEDKLDRIFDPFFTTKPTGQGTGLGLTVTRKIIESHGGTIDVRNRREGGVKLSLTFQTDTELDSTEQKVSVKTTGGG